MLVTGFYDLERFEERRTSQSEWVQRTSWLRSQPQRVIYVNSHGDEPLVTLPANWRVLHVAAPDFEDEWRVKRNLKRSLVAWDPMKDSGKYFCLMRHRIHWMAAAARWVGPEQVLTWIDMGIPHEQDDDLQTVLDLSPPPEKIRLCAISYVPRAARGDLKRYYERHWWPVGGGLWAARRAEIEWLAAEIEREWSATLQAGLVATDEMMLGRILLRYPERFDIYYGDHPTLIRNWQKVRGSHRLITEMALRALEDGNASEAHRRFAALAAGTEGTKSC